MVVVGRSLFFIVFSSAVTLGSLFDASAWIFGASVRSSLRCSDCVAVSVAVAGIDSIDEELVVFVFVTVDDDDDDVDDSDDDDGDDEVVDVVSHSDSLDTC